jgi:hypothetical protein
MDNAYDETRNEMLESYGLDDFLETQDLMDILEPDYLENNILIDSTGNLSVHLSIDEESLHEMPNLDALHAAASPLSADQSTSEASDASSGQSDPAASKDPAANNDHRDAFDGLMGSRASAEALKMRPLEGDSNQLGRIARYFDATEFVAASNKLHTSLNLSHNPHTVFLARAAERSLSQLPNHQTITVADLRDDGFVPLWDAPAGSTFGDLLKALNHPSHAGEADLYITDLSELELDEVSLPLPGTHLMLSRLRPDPDRPERVRGTLSLIGRVGVRSGAVFLKLVKEYLESPITLMV